jgi:hypothetical protein
MFAYQNHHHWTSIFLSLSDLNLNHRNLYSLFSAFAPLLNTRRIPPFFRIIWKCEKFTQNRLQFFFLYRVCENVALKAWNLLFYSLQKIYINVGALSTNPTICDGVEGKLNMLAYVILDWRLKRRKREWRKI